MSSQSLVASSFAKDPSVFALSIVVTRLDPLAPPADWPSLPVAFPGSDGSTRTHGAAAICVATRTGLVTLLLPQPLTASTEASVAALISPIVPFRRRPPAYNGPIESPFIAKFLRAHLPSPPGTDDGHGQREQEA